MQFHICICTLSSLFHPHRRCCKSKSLKRSRANSSLITCSLMALVKPSSLIITLLKRCPRKASSRMTRSKRLSSSTFPVWPQIQTFVKKVHQIVFSSHKTKLEGTLLEGKQWWLTSRRQTWHVHSLLFLNCTQQTEFVFFIVYPEWMADGMWTDECEWWRRRR